MTTLVYRDGILASDSQASADNILTCYVRKIGSKDGVLWGACGDLGEMQEFLDWMQMGMKGDAPEMNQSVGHIFHQGMSISRHDSTWSRKRVDYWADGSGASFALGALANGASAIEAVEAACKLDVFSSGTIQTVTV